MAKTPLDPPNEEEMEPLSLHVANHEEPRLLDRLPGGSPGLRTPSPHQPVPGLRVQKKQPRLASVTMELPDALAALAEQIRRAEKFLSKRPGSDRARVTLHHLELPAVNVGTEAFLETRREGKESCKIVVAYYNTTADTCLAVSELDDFPISLRMAVCESIPSLIEQAVAAQDHIADDVLAVADSIEQTLAKYRDITI
jgi:hypothetical protein